MNSSDARIPSGDWIKRNWTSEAQAQSARVEKANFSLSLYLKLREVWKIFEFLMALLKFALFLKFEKNEKIN